MKRFLLLFGLFIVIGLISAVVSIALLPTVEQAIEQEHARMTPLIQALEKYKQTHGVYPDTLDGFEVPEIRQQAVFSRAEGPTYCPTVSRDSYSLLTLYYPSFISNSGQSNIYWSYESGPGKWYEGWSRRTPTGEIAPYETDEPKKQNTDADNDSEQH